MVLTQKRLSVFSFSNPAVDAPLDARHLGVLRCNVVEARTAADWASDFHDHLMAHGAKNKRELEPKSGETRFLEMQRPQPWLRWDVPVVLMGSQCTEALVDAIKSAKRESRFKGEVA